MKSKHEKTEGFLCLRNLRFQRKAGVPLFSLMMLILFIGLSVTALVILTLKANKVAPKAIGERAFELFGAYSEGEKAMFYIDKAAELAAEEAVASLAEGGGSFGSSCDYTDDGYPIWNDPNGGCFDNMKKSLKKSYEAIFNNKVRNYLYKYPESSIKMPFWFNLTITEGSLKIIGNAYDPLIVGISKPTLFWSTEAPNSVSVEEYIGDASLAAAILTNSYSTNNVEYIMLHHTAGSTIEGALRAFASRGVSCHYVVGKDGTIVQAVPEERGAYCAGSGILPGMNTKAIGIEIVNLGNGKDVYPPEQVEAVRNLVTYLISKYNIQPGHLVGHGWYTDRKLPCEPCGFDYNFIAGWKVLTKEDRVLA